MDNIENTSSFLFYSSDDGKIKVQVIIDNQNETVWTSQKGMAEIFETTRENITIHLKNIFESKELDENSVSKEILHTASDGKNYKTKFVAKAFLIEQHQEISGANLMVWSTHYRQPVFGLFNEHGLAFFYSITRKNRRPCAGLYHHSFFKCIVCVWHGNRLLPFFPNTR